MSLIKSMLNSMLDVQTTNISVKVKISLKIKKSLNKLFIVYVNRLSVNVIIYCHPLLDPLVILDYFTFKLSYLIILIYIHINTIYPRIFWTNLSVLLSVSNVSIQVLLELRSPLYTDMNLFKKNNMKDVLWFFLTSSWELPTVPGKNNCIFSRLYKEVFDLCVTRKVNDGDGCASCQN